MVRTKEIILLVVILVVCQFNIMGEWKWNPETGWINDKYNPRGQAQFLFSQAKQIEQKGQYEEAFVVFQKILENYPYTPEGKKALYLAAECQYKLQNYYEAYLLYQKYLDDYPKNEISKEILTKQYEIGSILIRGKGKKRSELGFRMLSSAPLGIEILEKLVETATYFKYASDAQLTIANYYFKEEEYQEAQINYKKVIKNYPESIWCSFAQYQIAKCSLAQFQGKYNDSQPLIQAREAFKKYTVNYPDGKEAKKVKEHQKKIHNLLAEKELVTAKFYKKKGYPFSAKIYLQNIIENFKDTPSAFEAKVLLSEWYNL